MSLPKLIDEEKLERAKDAWERITNVRPASGSSDKKEEQKEEEEEKSDELKFAEAEENDLGELNPESTPADTQEANKKQAPVNTI